MLETNFCLNQFSKVEETRLDAWFCETRIATLTRKLAASFESMAKSLDLYFNLDITSDEELVCQMKQKMFIDKDMYEKILFNLCKCQQLINLY